ncbi:hypothetical protein SKAU_G00273950 [Synaphobranchus kaupii]|uniref:Integrase zinc-binding domain-containing protein n=1 Tax=Synaphobranchus kaupii TaxID=118154 RepID=A0A9Q1F155_SYNKA|nr:hypothetical protein SKAU_G00273950 [Synaphobranchus kaupii]
MDKCAEAGELECMTAHPGFEGVCLNEWVLQAVHNQFRQLYGEMPEASVEGLLRHCSYRNFVRWCWGFLGRRVRVVIPSCIITRIREKFPEASGQYVGFNPPPTPLSEDTLHPIVLAPDHSITQLIVQDYDERLLHAGPERVFTEIRRTYWILCGRQAVKKHQRQCLGCRKWRSKPMVPKMADLPSARLRLN